jgi:hypothetical protein
MAGLGAGGAGRLIRASRALAPARRAGWSLSGLVGSWSPPSRPEVNKRSGVNPARSAVRWWSVFTLRRKPSRRRGGRARVSRVVDVGEAEGVGDRVSRRRPVQVIGEVRRDEHRVNGVDIVGLSPCASAPRRCTRA